MEDKSPRPSWLEYFKSLALLTATRSPCLKLSVGCLLVIDNRVVSQGYNGYLPGAAHKQMIRNDHELGTVHAEQNAIADCAKRGVSCKGATAYITHYPCVDCIKILLAAGIQKIYFIEDYHNDLLVKEFAHSVNVTIDKLA